MRLEHGAIGDLKEQIREIVGRHVDLRTHRLFFFGSRVQGNGDERSDIDVGIEGPAALTGSVRAAIEEELENLPTLYTVQLVDFRSVSPEFRKVALQHMEPF